MTLLFMLLLFDLLLKLPVAKKIKIKKIQNL